MQPGRGEQNIDTRSYVTTVVTKLSGFLTFLSYTRLQIAKQAKILSPRLLPIEALNIPPFRGSLGNKN